MADEVTATVEPDEIVEKTVNSNGQVYIGRDHGGKTVRIAYEIIDEEE